MAGISALSVCLRIRNTRPEQTWPLLLIVASVNGKRSLARKGHADSGSAGLNFSSTVFIQELLLQVALVNVHWPEKVTGKCSLARKGHEDSGSAGLNFSSTVFI